MLAQVIVKDMGGKNVEMLKNIRNQTSKGDLCQS